MTTEVSEKSVVEPEDRVEACMQGPAQDWPNWIFSALCDRVENSAHGSKANLQKLHTLLRNGFQEAWAGIPVEVRQAMLRDKSVESGIYRLGELAFAQQLVGHAFRHRVDDDFEEIVRNELNLPLVQLLHDKDDELSVLELATATGIDEVEVRKRLQALLQKGAVEFRSSPTVRYFLTHAGTSVMK